MPPHMTVMRDVAIAKSEFVQGEKAVNKVQDFQDDAVLFGYCQLPQVSQIVDCKQLWPTRIVRSDTFYGGRLDWRRRNDGNAYDADQQAAGSRWIWHSAFIILSPSCVCRNADFAPSLAPGLALFPVPTRRPRVLCVDSHGKSASRQWLSGGGACIP